MQEESESVSDYSARFQRYASTCKFGEFLNCSLRDQFVRGVRDPSTREKLLNEDRTFQDALKVAVADEVTSKETLEVQNDPKPDQDSVHSVGKTRNPRSFTVGEKVLARYYQGKDEWVQGVIAEVLGSRHCMVQVFGSVWKRHIDQLLKNDAQLEHEGESDEAEISTENSSATSATEKSPETSP